MGNRLKNWSLRFALSLALAGIFGCASAPHPLPTTNVRNPNLISSEDSGAPETELLKKLMWPVTHHRVTQEFKAEGDGRPHDGIDISAPRGTRIFAPADGHVVYAGHKFHGYGKMIIIEHNEGLATIYGHLQKLLVRSGDLVRRGSLIGLVGQTGRATAPHLHFEVRFHHEPVDPLEFLP